jgi:hypothetical protein
MVGLATALLLIEMCIVSPLPRVLSVSCMLRVGQPMPVKYILHKPAMTHGHRTVICRLHNGKALRFKSEDWKTSSSNVGTSRGLKEPGEIVGDDDAAQDYRCAGTMRFPPPRRILPHLEGKCADTQSEVDTKVNNLSTVAGLSCTSKSYVSMTMMYDTHKDGTDEAHNSRHARVQSSLSSAMS